MWGGGGPSVSNTEQRRTDTKEGLRDTASEKQQDG